MECIHIVLHQIRQSFHCILAFLHKPLKVIYPYLQLNHLRIIPLQNKQKIKSNHL